MENKAYDLAISDFINGKKNISIVVKSDLAENDVLPVDYLARTYDIMPELEKLAIENSAGDILDVGAGLGAHALVMQEQNKKVTALDSSKTAVDFMLTNGIEAYHSSFLDFKSQKSFDTLLFLMNGIGIAKNLEELPDFLEHCKKIIKKSGKIILDSTDVSYFYQEDDGSMWIDLNSSYFGEFKFQMCYKNLQSDWFEWLYIDFDLLKKYAENSGLSAKCLYTKEGAYLAELTFKS